MTETVKTGIETRGETDPTVEAVIRDILTVDLRVETDTGEMILLTVGVEHPVETALTIMTGLELGTVPRLQVEITVEGITTTVATTEIGEALMTGVIKDVAVIVMTMTGKNLRIDMREEILAERDLVRIDKI